MDEVTNIFKENNIFYNIIGFLIAENEKFFDRSDSKLYWKTVYHMAFIFHHSFVGLYASGFDFESSEHSFLRNAHQYKLGLLTGWNFTFQIIFLALSLSYDFIEWNEQKETETAKKIKYAANIVYTSMVVPFTLFVAAMFWGLFAIDRELVYPVVLDEAIPFWYNHCVHTNILGILIVETLLEPRRKPFNAKLEGWLCAFFSVGYAVVFYPIYLFGGVWLYRVFSIMTWWQVCLFQCFIWLCSYTFYKIQFPINRLFHQEETEEEKTGPIKEKRESAKIKELQSVDIFKLDSKFNNCYQ